MTDDPASRLCAELLSEVARLRADHDPGNCFHCTRCADADDSQREGYGLARAEVERLRGSTRNPGRTRAGLAAHMSIDLVAIENAHMIHHDRGSSPEPPLDQSWPDLIKLKWHAALVRSETGINVTVHLQPQDYPGDYYQVTLSGPGWSSCTVHTYRNAWLYLNGIKDGAIAAQKVGCDDHP